MSKNRVVRLSHLNSRAGFDNTKLIVEPKSRQVSFEPVNEINPSKIETAYDAKNGVLSIVTEYGIFEASGFLTPDGLGTGPRGKKGPRGKDGRNGRQGFDGREGKPGCPGPIGPIGPKGLAGLDAEDGPQGAMGLIGCGGDVGPTGFMGPTGPTGPQGPRGLPGDSCLRGETGDQGPTPYPYVVIAQSQPDDPLVYIWAQPFTADSGEIPEEPVVIQPMVGNIPSRSITLSPTAGTFYEGIAAYSLSGFSGGVGPFMYKWSGDFESDATLSTSETGTTATNMNIKCRVSIASGQSVDKQGNVTLTITDVGDNNKKLVLTGTYRFRGTNASSGGGGGGGGGGSGCIVYGMRINLNAAHTQVVENIMNGDQLLGLDVKGLPDSSVDETGYLYWSSRELDASPTYVNVAQAIRSSYHTYYVINDLLKITLEEPMLVLRNSEWSFIRVKDLIKGDKLYHMSGTPVEITSIQIIEEQVNVCSLNVEHIDTYFVEGFLVHNRDLGSVIIK